MIGFRSTGLGAGSGLVHEAQFGFRIARLVDRLVIGNAAVFQHDEAAGVFSHGPVMGDHSKRPAFTMQALEDGQHFQAIAYVEVSGRLVSQEDHRVSDESAGDRHALLFSAR
jgi:hypothetical protein